MSTLVRGRCTIRCKRPIAAHLLRITDSATVRYDFVGCSVRIIHPHYEVGRIAFEIPHLEDEATNNGDRYVSNDGQSELKYGIQLGKPPPDFANCWFA